MAAMHIQRNSPMYLHRVVSTNRTKREQMKTKGDDWQLYSTAIVFLFLRTTLDLYCDVALDKISYRATLIDLVYRIYTIVER